MDRCSLLPVAYWLLFAVFVGASPSAAFAQSAQDREAQVVTTPSHTPSKSELTATAWKLLEDALADDKHPDMRIQGLAALGTMGGNARAGKMIAAAFADPDMDVRTAAVLAAGQTKNRTLIPGLRKLLDDKEPQVAFAAACTLWKMGDHSGEDLLEAVVDGDRQGRSSMVHGSLHAANKKLHDPVALARLGAVEGAQVLLGPFGFGISAYEYMKRNGGGGTPRVTAIEELSQIKSPAVRDQLLGAVTDKDPAVRAAAAKALSGYHDAEANHALEMLFQDSKRPVQLSGAAAYLISVGAVATPVRQLSAE